MYYKRQFTALKKRLQNQYSKLVEISNNYRFLDESISDIAAYKAMKLLQKRFLRESREFEITEDAVLVRIKSGFKEEKLT